MTMNNPNVGQFTNGLPISDDATFKVEHPTGQKEIAMGELRQYIGGGGAAGPFIVGEWEVSTSLSPLELTPAANTTITNGELSGVGYVMPGIYRVTEASTTVAASSYRVILYSQAFENQSPNTVTGCFAQFTSPQYNSFQDIFDVFSTSDFTGIGSFFQAIGGSGTLILFGDAESPFIEIPFADDSGIFVIDVVNGRDIIVNGQFLGTMTRGTYNTVTVGGLCIPEVESNPPLNLAAFTILDVELPEGATNGSVYKILGNGTYNGYELTAGDYVKVYSDTSLIVVRLPADGGAGLGEAQIRLLAVDAVNSEFNSDGELYNEVSQLIYDILQAQLPNLAGNKLDFGSGSHFEIYSASLNLPGSIVSNDRTVFWYLTEFSNTLTLSQFQNYQEYRVMVKNDNGVAAKLQIVVPNANSANTVSYSGILANNPIPSGSNENASFLLDAASTYMLNVVCVNGHLFLTFSDPVRPHNNYSNLGSGYDSLDPLASHNSVYLPSGLDTAQYAQILPVYTTVASQFGSTDPIYSKPRRCITVTTDQTHLRVRYQSPLEKIRIQFLSASYTTYLWVPTLTQIMFSGGEFLVKSSEIASFDGTDFTRYDINFSALPANQVELFMEFDTLSNRYLLEIKTFRLMQVAQQ